MRLSSAMLSLKQLVGMCVLSASVLHTLCEDKSPQQVIDCEMTKWTGGGLAVALVSAAGTQFFFRGNTSATNPRGLPDKNTLFNVGPVSKGFTGLLLADQILAGSVSLNDTLEKLLPNWSGRGNASTSKITLLQLATQSSGIPMPAIDIDTDYQAANFTDHAEVFYDWLDSVDLIDPGTYNEGDVDSAVLGYVLALRAGKSYEELLKERVLLPLGLRNTTVKASEDQEEWVGTMHSSASDLASFVQVAMGIRQGEPALNKALDLAVRNWAPVDTLTNTSLGWMLGKVQGDIVLTGQSGNAYSSGSIFVGWFTSLKKGVVVLSNTESTRIDELAVSLLVLDF